MNENPQNTDYESPSITLHVVELEHAIASASATVTPGGPGGPTDYNPQVEDWIEDTGQSGRLDF
jgi:hypothetical protein